MTIPRFRSALTAVLVLVGACTQLPTDKAAVVDLRPQVSFKPGALDVSQARVMVDGLEAGAVGDFVDGRAALRVLPGTHQLQVVSAGRTLLDQRIYLGDGVSRAFQLP